MPSAKKCAEKYKKGSKEYKACRAYKAVAGAAEFAVPVFAAVKAARGISKLSTKKSKSSKVIKKSRSSKGRMY